MNFIKRAYWNVTSRLGKSMLLLIVLTVISVLVLSGLTIQTAANQSSIMAREKLGGEVTLTVDREKLMETQQDDAGRRARFEPVPIPEDSANELKDSNYVKGYNYYSSTTAFANGFNAIGSEVTESSSDQGQGFGGGRMAGDVSIQGVSYTDASESFMNGQATLLEGRHLTAEDENQQVTLIEKNLASENDLSVGDSLTVSNADGVELNLEIVGIYETTAEIDDRAQNITSLNPYNQLFVPVTAASTLKGSTGTIDRAVYFMKDPIDIQAFMNDAKASTSIDFNQFKLDANDQLYQQMMGPIENVASFSGHVVILVTIAGAIILALIIMMTIRERKYEMGVLLAIGERKSKLISQFLIEITIVAFIAMGISTFSGNLVAEQIGKQLLQQEITTSETADMPASLPNSRRNPFQQQLQDVDVVDELSIDITSGDLMRLFFIGLLVVLVSTILPSLTVLRLHPKTILTKD
ncbi:ABC transporter permease [Rossellomorea aquimaris]|uniref:ABC transporter permease n=1 Tax=Rossellomorea aquimaris TaxID=189382 RepID=UPI001CD6F69F|nr:ABC transporter permease [Rossellomorea aquimaris]MCA1056537.1 ABC transporter permease [Rossellomorea aquimaris]